jgi:hypothetical protein
VRPGAAGGGRHGHPGRPLRGSRRTGSRPPRSPARRAACGVGLVLGLEDTPSRMNRIGRSELDYGHQRTVTDSLDRITAVTPRRRRRARGRAAQPAVHGGGGGPVRRRGRAPGRAALTHPPRHRPTSHPFCVFAPRRRGAKCIHGVRSRGRPVRGRWCGVGSGMMRA